MVAIPKLGESRTEVLRVTAQANSLEFAQIAPARFSGPLASKPLLSVGFVPKATFFSARTNKQDIVTLENISGSALHDCVVLVRLKNKSGETFANVHFVREWAAGTKRVATYDSGPFGHTVDDPAIVTAQAWARESSSPAVETRAGLVGW